MFWKGRPAGFELKDEMKKHTQAVNDMKDSIDNMAAIIEKYFAGGTPPPPPASGIS